MTIQVNIARAKATLSDLVARAEAGEEVVLSRNGRPVARISAVAGEESRKTRKLGVWDHLNLTLSDDLFIGPDPETLDAVDGPIFPADDEAAA